MSIFAIAYFKNFSSPSSSEVRWNFKLQDQYTIAGAPVYREICLEDTKKNHNLKHDETGCDYFEVFLR